MKSNRTHDGNSRGNNHGKERRVELKYCEYCGSLWTRVYGGGQVYCDRCLAQFGEFPVQPVRSRALAPILAPGARFEKAFDLAAGFSVPDDLALDDPSFDDLDLDGLDLGDLELDDLDLDALEFDDVELDDMDLDDLDMHAVGGVA
jgi:hypothetical protein